VTVLEMHISLRQGVDRINSLRNDQLRTEEVDLELNRAQLRFINQRYGRNNPARQGFEESQKRIDDLRNLVKEYSDQTFFKEEIITGKVWVDSFQLPSDYLYLLNQRSTIITQGCEPVSFNLQPLDGIHWFSFYPDQFSVQGNEYLRLNMADGTNTAIVWEPSQELLTAQFQYASFPQSNTAVMNDMLSNPGTGFTFHWQTFKEIDLPGQMIVIVDTDTHPWFNQDLSLGALSFMNSIDQLNQTVNTAQPQFTPSQYEKRVPIGPYEKTQVLNRFSQLDDIYKLLNDPFNTTSHREPLTTIRDSFIDVYTNAISLIESVKITYLRQPLPISLSLGYDCELPYHTHEEIVSMAVSAILESQMDPRYRTQMAELVSRE
jgi:hypothetical protein